MKKRLAIILLNIFMMNMALAQAPFQGHAEFDDEYTTPDEKLFTGKTETLEK